MSLSHHPPVPPDCPGMNKSGDRWLFGVSWADDELDLAEAHLHDDVYTVVGSICYWWAMRSGDHVLAQQWADWLDECGDVAAGNYEEEDLVD